MFLHHWLKNWHCAKYLFRRSQRPRAKPRFNRLSSSALLEVLEARTLLTTIDLANLGSNGNTLFGGHSFDFSGRTVSDAGDVNGDGFDDVIIGASGSAYTRGSSVVIFGGLALPSRIDLATPGSFGFVLLGADVNDRSGGSVSAAGDVNGDGFADLLVGSKYAAGPDNDKPNLGETYIVFGRAAMPSLVDLGDLGSGGVTIYGVNTDDFSAAAVSSAGDVNGDGFDDVLIGASMADGLDNAKADSGEVYLVFGRSSMPRTINLTSLGSGGVRIVGAESNDRAGGAVSGAGDVNADGFDDVIIGAEYGDGDGNGNAQSGESYIIFGKATLPQLVDLSVLGGLGIALYGADLGDYSGASVSSAGDVNGDGFGDVIIGAPYADGPANNNSRMGESYLVFGAATLSSKIALGSLNSSGTTIFGVSSYDLSGASVSAAGDVNGDGFDDVLIGANGYGFELQYSGETYLIFGGSALPKVISAAALSSSRGITLVGIDQNDRSGSAVSAAGDVDGDGFADLIIGAPQGDAYANSKVDAGESYLVYGANFTNAVTLNGNQTSQTLTGTIDADIINGAAGHDTLIGNGGPDVIYGGQGNDIMAVSDTAFRRVNGGNGNDTLRLDGNGLLLDLTTLPEGLLTNLEAIDIRGNGANTLVLDQSEVLQITASSNSAHTSNKLAVLRDVDDTVTIGPDWTQGSVQEAGGIFFDVYTQGAATLFVQNTDPFVTLSISSEDMVEGGGTATVTATLTATTDVDVTIALGFSGTANFPADFTSTATQIVIPAGSTTGSVTLTAVQDAEFEVNQQIVVKILTVTNAIEEVPQQVTKTITDDDHAPVFTSTATPSVPENSTAVLTVAATDDDLPSQIITYSITGGADDDLFSITSDGMLSFTAAPDFEVPTDTNIDNVYQVQVSANDGHGGVTTQNVAVTVTNVAEDVELSVAGQAVKYVKKQLPVHVLPNATAGGINLGGGTLAIDLTVVSTKRKLLDEVSFLLPLESIGSSPGRVIANGHLTLFIQLDLGTTAAAVQDFLRGMTFVTKGKGLKTPNRTLHVTLTNASNQSASITQTINVQKKP